MSIMGMRTKMSKYLKGLVLAIAVAFVIGFVGMSVGGGRSGPQIRESGVLAKVNGEKLMWEDYVQALQRETERYEMTRQELGVSREIGMRGQEFDKMVEQSMMLQAAREEGIRVSRRDLRKKIDEYTDMRMKQRREVALTGKKQKTDAVFEAELAKETPGMTIAKKRNEFRRELYQYADEIRDSLMIEKLGKKIEGSVVVNARTLEESYDQTAISQITVAAAGKRSDEQARKRAEEIIAKLKKGDDFAAVAKQYSDDPLKATGGMRGAVRRASIEPELRDAAFKLKRNEISKPIKTAQGYVILKSAGVVRNLPADFKDPNKKSEYMAAFRKQATDTARQEYDGKLRKALKLEIFDPELKAYVAFRDAYQNLMAMSEMERKKAVEKVIGLYQSATVDASNDTALQARCYIQIATLYGMIAKSPEMFSLKKEEIPNYEKLTRSALQSALIYTEDISLRLSLAKMDIEARDYKAAEENLQTASENAYDEAQSHEAIRDMYTSMNRPDLAAEQQKWIDEFKKEQAANGVGSDGTATTQPMRIPVGGQ